jgi:hypothetical protein
MAVGAAVAGVVVGCYDIWTKTGVPNSMNIEFYKVITAYRMGYEVGNLRHSPLIFKLTHRQMGFVPKISIRLTTISVILIHRSLILIVISLIRR